MPRMTKADRMDRVLKSFLNGVSDIDGNLQVLDGNVVHYHTCIATFNTACDVVIVNDSKYSQQTRPVQNRLKVLLEANQRRFVTVSFDNTYGGKFGVNANDLRSRYAHDLHVKLTESK